MKKIYLSIRIAAIYALAFVATFGIFGCPDENLSFGDWLASFAISKAIGFAAVVGIAEEWHHFAGSSVDKVGEYAVEAVGF